MTVLATVMEFCCCAEITYLWILLTVRCTYYMSEISEIIGVHYQGILILCIYRQSGVYEATLVDSFTRFRVANSHLPIIIIVGDFNVYEHKWLDSSFTYAVGDALCGFCKLYGLSQLVDQGTCDNAILDLAISEYTGTVFYHPHLGTSDHIVISVRFNVSLHVPSLPSFRRVRILPEVCSMESYPWLFSSSLLGQVEV